jgi:ferredoxin
MERHSSTPMPHALRIEPLGRTITVACGQTLLDAARSDGIELRSSCRNGTCRECMARVVEGSVRYRIEWPGLLAEEKAEGWVLPCVALAASDLVLLQPHAVAKD